MVISEENESEFYIPLMLISHIQNTVYKFKMLNVIAMTTTEKANIHKKKLQRKEIFAHNRSQV